MRDNNKSETIVLSDEPEEIEVIPDPTALIESMRAVGYSVEAAVADVVDNSISADAVAITIEYDILNEPYIAILDDGHGMSSAGITNAMRHGSQNPGCGRKVNDLGRFGLGLKTASLSQCRKLTVVSKMDGEIHARQWNLDVVADRKRWIVLIPGHRELESIPLFHQLNDKASGTLVVWQNLDRLIAKSNDMAAEIKVKLQPLYDHLALVFHRFTDQKENETPIEITVNGLKVPSRDPFLSHNHFRQPLEGQTIKSEHGNVLVKPYILPPLSHLTPEEIELAGGREGLRSSQGFYVYRARRLVIWGTWFRLVPKDEFYKLTRVQVDIPNSFDELWALDIKKSTAFPPDSIRNRLKELIPHFANASRRTLTHSGRKMNRTGAQTVWDRVETSHSLFRYQVNLEHPVVQAVSEKLQSPEQRLLVKLLQVLGDSLPFESIYADMCNDNKGKGSTPLIGELVVIAKLLRDLTGSSIDIVLKMDPLIRFSQFHNQVRMELSDES